MNFMSGRTSKTIRPSGWNTVVQRLGPAALLLLWAGCGQSREAGESETITREIFVETYVELRMAVLESPDGRISVAGREEILEAAAVTEDDLLEFARVHGRRVQFMAEVWEEIDDTLRALRTQDTDP